ncbi:MAG: efflux RND transporter periplasmic adaptor subunit [Patescibacteria group bacterium]
MKNFIKHSLIAKIVLAVIVLGLLYVGYTAIVSTKQKNVKPYTVKSGSITQMVSAVGNVVFGNMDELNFPISGKLSQVYVKDGQNVQVGEKLASLTTTTLEENVQTAQNNYDSAQQKINALYGQASQDVQTAQNALNQAQATLNTDQTNLNSISPTSPNYQTLESKVQSDNTQVSIDQQNLQSAQQEPLYYNLAPLIDAKNNAYINLEQAQSTLAQATLVSPINGTVIFLSSIAPNEQVGASSQGGSKGIASAQSGISNVAGNSFITIANTKSAQIFSYVDESSIAKVSVGQSVDISLTAYPNQKFKGSVVSIEPSSTIIQNVVNYGVTISIDNPPSSIKLGMSANVNIITSQASNTLLIPNSALVYTTSGKPLVILDQNGKYTKKSIQTGISNIYFTQVTGGLKAGDKIVVNGNSSFKIKSTSTKGLLGGKAKGGGSKGIGAKLGL